VASATGRVKFYDPEKGFGFLSQDSAGADVYVAKSALARGVEGLKPGQTVEFQLTTGPRGLYARSVRPMSADPSTTAATAEKVAGIRLSPKELHTLIADMIMLLDATVMPELRRGHYPEPVRSKPAAEMVRALAGDLDSYVAASERHESTRAATRSASSRRRHRTPPH
jgi:CspA family cold shock protein